ncbi:hypothetical protein CLU79DRAFT_891039 [Phycomyces nitens]|nr:hypothetical protein CLU79DRAFT_891039 [Phycomyces nitens]
MPITKQSSEYSIASLNILPNSTLRSTTFQDQFTTRRRSVFLYPFSKNSRKYDSFLSAKDYDAPQDNPAKRTDFTRLLEKLKVSIPQPLNTRSRNSISTSDISRQQELFGNYHLGKQPKSTSLLQRIFRRNKSEKWEANIFSDKIPQGTHSPHLAMLISKFPTIDSPNGSFVWPDPEESN